MNVLVLCATQQSISESRTKALLDNFFHNTDRFTFYFVGPEAGAGRDRCPQTIHTCLPQMGRQKFDVLVNEYCPIYNKRWSILHEMVEAFALLKKKAFFITPMFPNEPPSYGGDEIAWAELMEMLGFEWVAFNAQEHVALFERR